ncbi:hypothetical protein ACTXT7_008316 [Hymenolepis weldensis]
MTCHAMLQQNALKILKQWVSEIKQGPNSNWSLKPENSQSTILFVPIRIYNSCLSGGLQAEWYTLLSQLVLKKLSKVRRMNCNPPTGKELQFSAYKFYCIFVNCGQSRVSQ